MLNLTDRIRLAVDNSWFRAYLRWDLFTKEPKAPGLRRLYVSESLHNPISVKAETAVAVRRWNATLWLVMLTERRPVNALLMDTANAKRWLRTERVLGKVVPLGNTRLMQAWKRLRQNLQEAK